MSNGNCSYLSWRARTEAGIFGSGWEEMLFVLGQVELPHLLLYIGVKCRLPELHTGPHRMVLHTAVGELDDTRAEFLENRGDMSNELLAIHQNKFIKLMMGPDWSTG